MLATVPSICKCNHKQFLSWSIVPLEKLKVVQLISNLPTFFGTWRIITMFTRAHHFSLSLARWIQTIPSYHISVGSIIISSHLCLSLQSGPCPSGTHTKLIMHFCSFPCMSYTFLIFILHYLFGGSINNEAPQKRTDARHITFYSNLCVSFSYSYP